MEPDVAVLGGGISGLVVAERLQRLGFQTAVFEEGPHAGGVIGTDCVEGFVFERGPAGFAMAAPETVRLIEELNLSERLLAPSPLARKRYLKHEGRLVPMPAGLGTFLGSPLLSLRAKLRVLAEPFVSPRKDEAFVTDESVAAFLRRRLGEEAGSLIAEALVTGIFGGDPERLSAEAAFPALVRMEQEHGSLFRGALKGRRKRKDGEGRSRALLYSFPRGLGELVGRLASLLGGSVHPGRPVREVRPRGDGGGEIELEGGEVIRARAVVVAVPAWRAQALFEASAPKLAARLEGIPYAPIAAVSLGYRRAAVPHALDGFGYLAPTRESPDVLGMIWTSSVFPAHAPKDGANLRVLLGGVRAPEIAAKEDEALIERARRECEEVLGAQGDPVAARAYCWPRALPQYEIGHCERVDAIESACREHAGLFLTGNAYRGVGVNDCIREAFRTASRVAEYLGAAGKTEAGAPAEMGCNGTPAE